MKMTSELVYHVRVPELRSYDWGVLELHIKVYCMKKGVNGKIGCFYNNQTHGQKSLLHFEFSYSFFVKLS